MATLPGNFYFHLWMQPVVIHIGYPKAGSTFLQQYFSAHPQITYSGNMLGHYKRTGQVEVRLPEQNDIKTIIISEEQLSVWQGKLDIVGVRFLDYDIEAHQQKVAEKLKQLYPDAKILIVTRGFATALQSTYSQYISIGGILSFAEFQQQFGAIFARFYNYNYLITLYRRLFGEAQVVVMPFEWLKEDNAAFVKYMERQFVFYPLETAGMVYNESLKADELHSYLQLSNRLYKAIKILPRSLQEILYGTYVYLLYQRKLSWLIKENRQIAPLPAVNSDTLALFHGKATILRTENLFQPYLKEYLL